MYICNVQLLSLALLTAYEMLFFTIIKLRALDMRDTHGMRE